jgi:predicted phosphodiesterase
MTQLAILSDIHGNLPALEAVLNDLAQFKVDQVIVAGDVINWGPFSAPVLERVVREGWPVIRGNNEFYLLDYNTPRALGEWSNLGQWPMLPWLHRQLNGRWQKVIAAWPDTLSLRFGDAPPLRVVHGSPRSAFEAMHSTNTDAELTAMLAGVEETTVVAGHTHLALDRRVDGWHLLNSGTVGIPLNGRVGEVCYLLLEGDATGWHPTWRYLNYDLGPVFAEFARQGFVDECGIVGHFVIAEYKTARLNLLPFLRWRAATCPTAPFSADLLEPFSKANIWDYTPPAYHVNL